MALRPQDGHAATLLERIAAEPALVQLLALVFIGFIGAWYLARIGRRVRDARSRAGIGNHLLGIESALHGDVEGALRRLDRVVREDPGNRIARLVRAECLTAVGRGAEAHAEHVALERAFEAHGPRNGVGTANALLAAGRAAEATEIARALVASHPEHLDALRGLVAAARAAGRDTDVVAAGARLAARLAAGDERDEARSAVADAAERAFGAALRGGQDADAQRLLRAARGALGDTAPAIRRIEARLAIARAATHALPPPEESVPQVPAVLAEELTPAIVDTRERLAVLEFPGRILDAVEANPEHVARLCRAFVEGDPDARAELVEMTTDASDALFAHAIELGPADTRFGALYHSHGAAGLRLLIAAWQRRGAIRAGRAERDRELATLSAIVRGFGPEAHAVVDELLSHDDRALRRVAVDWFLAQADPAAFEHVVDVLSPVEVVQRMNEVDDELLVPFLRALPEGHVVLDVLLADGGCSRDVAMLDAIPGARAPQALESLVVRRGFARSLVGALIERLASPRLGAIAGRVLDAFGARAVPPLVIAFADPERTPALHQEIGRRLVAAGSAAVLPLCGCFGAGPGELDEDVRRLLVEIGDVAVPSLREAYRQGGLLERIAGPFARRRTHRREMIVRTLASLGSLAARTTLVGLRERESDADLALRLQQAIHKLDADGARRALPPPDDVIRKEGHGS